MTNKLAIRLWIAAAFSMVAAPAFSAVTNDVFIIDTATIVDLYSATFDGGLTACDGSEPDPDACIFFNGEPPPPPRAITIASNPASEATGTLNIDYDDVTGEIIQVNALHINLPDEVLTILGAAFIEITQGNAFPAAQDDLFIDAGTGTLGRDLDGAGVFTALGQGTPDPDESSPALGPAVFEHDDAPNLDAPDFVPFAEVVDLCHDGSGIPDSAPLCTLIPFLSLDALRYRLIGTVDSGAFQLQAETANNSIYKVDFTIVKATAEMAIPDLNGNGANEYAIVRNGTVGSVVPVTVEIHDGGTGTLIKRNSYHGNGIQPGLAVTVPDLNGNGLDEVAAMGINGGNIKLRVADAATNTEISKFSFYTSGHDPVGMTTLADVSGNGLSEVALLATRNSDNAIVVQVRDAKTGVQPFGDITFLNSGFTPLKLLTLPDIDGNGVEELAVLATRNSDTRAVVEIREGDGSAGFSRLWFLNQNFDVFDAVVGPDTDGNGIPEIAVLADRNSDGRIVVERRNATGTPAATRRWFFNEGGWSSEAFVALSDTGDADSAPEYAVLAVRNSDNRPAVELKNARDLAGAVPPATFRRFFLDDRFYALSVVDLGNTNGATNTETNIGVIGIRKSDGRGKQEVKDARGASNTTSIWFKP